MKSILATLALLVFASSIFAQNGTCSNDSGTLIIFLNTPDTVFHQINIPYFLVEPTLISKTCDSTTLSLTHTPNVNENKLGLYVDSYFGQDSCVNPVRCTRWVRIIDTTTAKVEVINLPRISVYPNPVSDLQFTFQLHDTYICEDAVIQLFDVNCREVFNAVYMFSGKSSFLVSLKDRGLEKGIYVLTVSQRDASIKRKIVIQ